MARGAIRLTPSELYVREGLYIQRRKIRFLYYPTIMQRKNIGGRDFYIATNGVALRDGSTQCVTDQQYVVAIFDFEPHRRFGEFLRLGVIGALNGGRRAPPYTGPERALPNPELIDGYEVHTPKERNLYGPDAILKPHEAIAPIGHPGPNPSPTFRTVLGHKLSARKDETPIHRDETGADFPPGCTEAAQPRAEYASLSRSAQSTSRK